MDTFHNQAEMATQTDRPDVLGLNGGYNESQIREFA